MKAYWMNTKGLLIFVTWELYWKMKSMYQMANIMESYYFMIATRTRIQGLIVGCNKHTFFQNVSRGSLMKIIFHIQRGRIRHIQWCMVYRMGGRIHAIKLMLGYEFLTSPKSKAYGCTCSNFEAYLTWWFYKQPR